AGSYEGLVKVWDAQTGRVSAEFSDHSKARGRKVGIFCLAWHPKGHRIASAGGLDTVRVWDARTAKEGFYIPAGVGSFYNSVASSPDGRYLVTGRFNGAVEVWDGETDQEVGKDNVLDTHKREIGGLVFSRDGQHFASASRDGIVKLWDATRLNEKQEP